MADDLGSASSAATAADAATGGAPASFDTSPGALPIFVQADGAAGPMDQGTAAAESASASQAPGLEPGKPASSANGLGAVPAAVALPAPASGWSAIVQQESGGHQFDSSGNPLRSSAGAVGIAQIMPQTGPEAAELAGVPWDPKRFEQDPAYNAQLGEAYYDHQLKVFGTPDKAAAAYNAGPSRVSSAIAKAASSTGTGNYLDYLPQETQNYVKSVTGNSGRTFGASGSLGQSSSPGQQPGATSAAAAASDESAVASANKIRELYTLLAPGHKLTPIDYDPFKVAPEAGKTPKPQVYTPPEVKATTPGKALAYKLPSAGSASVAAGGLSGDID